MRERFINMVKRILDVIDRQLAKLEKENQALRLKIRDVHVTNGILEEDLKRVKSLPLFKIWRIFKQIYKLLKHE